MIPQFEEIEKRFFGCKKLLTIPALGRILMVQTKVATASSTAKQRNPPEVDTFRGVPCHFTTQMRFRLLQNFSAAKKCLTISALGRILRAQTKVVTASCPRQNNGTPRKRLTSEGFLVILRYVRAADQTAGCCRLLSAQPFVDVARYHTCHDGKKKSNNSVHDLAPFPAGDAATRTG